MKVSKTPATDPLRQFNLVIEVTSKEEEDTLRKLFALNHTIPAKVRLYSDLDDEKVEILSRFFVQSFNALRVQ